MGFGVNIHEIVRMSILKTIDIKNGKVVFDDLSLLSSSIPLSNQLDELKEDLLQIEYPNQILIDAGWYPCFSEDGQFKVFVIKGDDWENPMMKVNAKDLIDLQDALIKAVELAS